MLEKNTVYESAVEFCVPSPAVAPVIYFQEEYAEETIVLWMLTQVWKMKILRRQMGMVDLLLAVEAVARHYAEALLPALESSRIQHQVTDRVGDRDNKLFSRKLFYLRWCVSGSSCYIGHCKVDVFASYNLALFPKERKFHESRILFFFSL